MDDSKLYYLKLAKVFASIGRLQALVNGFGVKVYREALIHGHAMLASRDNGAWTKL